ncbi:hypothetical protein DFJ77DRAFT_514109 [Powellomyces hirtus]|nr:hypothetical protein DFJ77DRAFT_514109 [Powellomyces hirtus]
MAVSSVQAQLPAGAAEVINPNLPATCQPSFSAAVIQLINPCGLTEALPYVTSTNVSWFDAGKSLVNSNTFMNALCSDSCTASYQNAAAPLRKPFVAWARSLACRKSSAGDFFIRNITRATNGNLVTAFDNQATYCTECGNAFGTALKNTSGVPASFLPILKETSANVTAQLAACPSSSINRTNSSSNSTTDTARSSQSSASKVAGISFAGAVMFAVASILA